MSIISRVLGFLSLLTAVVGNISSVTRIPERTIGRWAVGWCRSGSWPSSFNQDEFSRRQVRERAVNEALSRLPIDR